MREVAPQDNDAQRVMRVTVAALGFALSWATPRLRGEAAQHLPASRSMELDSSARRAQQ
jgi:hypothetical protein